MRAELIDRTALLDCLRERLEDVEYGMVAYGLEEAIAIVEDQEPIKITRQ